jgi:lipopolysaccharide biosynthesis regulator YciM
MKTAGASLLLIVMALIVFAARPALAKDEWINVKSKNFNMIGNAGEKEIRRVAGKLEQFREAFRQFLPDLKFDSPVPTTVIVFKSGKSFEPFKPVDPSGKPASWVAGYFLKGEDINYIALSIEGEKEQTYRTIFHEYAHFLLDNAIGRSKLPAWLNEGLAEYYEKFRIEDDQKVALGALNNDHLTLLAQSGFISFDALFNTDYYSLNRRETNRAGIFYAQSWALIHYLLHADNGARRTELKTFIGLIVNGKTPKEAFAEAFRTDYATIEAELRKYIEQKRSNALAAVIKEKSVFDSQMRAFPIDEADSKAILGDLLLHARRFDEAETLLKQALALKPNSVQANISLGLARLRKNDSAEAIRLLKKAIELDDKSYLAHFQYAYILSREGMTAEGFVSKYDKDLADEIKSELIRSIALNPDFAESYALFALVSAVRNEDVDEAFALLNKALVASPGNQKYLIRAAELRLRKEDFAGARVIALKIFETASDAGMRLYAQTTLARINSTEAQLDEIKNFKKGASNPDIETEKPLTEEELARRSREAVNEGLNRALRKPAAGEKRLLGYIAKIECAGAKIEFSVKTAAQTIKFYARDFESLFLMTFSSDSLDAEIGCGTIKKDVLAVITYLPASKAGSNGEIVAIEFMPEGFELK